MSTVALRDYQEAILDALRDAFREGHKHVLLYAPTGAGKTEMAIDLMKASSDKYKRSAMVLDRIVLCDQTSKRLQKYNIDHGVLQAGHWRYRPYERIQVASAQTLEKRGSFPDLNLLIVDECHAQRKQTVEFIKRNSHLYVVGLSASPFADGLGDTYTRVVSAITTEELVKRGQLAPLRVFICKEVDMNGAKKVAGEWSQDDAAERGMKITGDVIAKWVEKTTEIFGGPVKTIAFSTNVAHGADMAQKFNEAGFNFVAISYKDSDAFKREVIEDFSRPDTAINGVIATDILTKGFDVADVRCGISARPFSKSFMAHVQQMGRTMRACDGKDFALWLDHSGNYLRFQEDWDELYHEGVTSLKDGKEQSKKEKTVEEKKQAKCPACDALWVGKSNTCAVCGFVRPFTNLVKVVDGEMEEVTGTAAKANKDQKQDWYSQLLSIAHERGYSDGWVAHKYKEKFGVWPRGLKDEEKPVSTEVQKWEKSCRIAWAKSKDKDSGARA
jgi:DNA repair protein RadD